MCGIISYRGEENASEKIVEGLKRLEYRGYDSAGIGTVGNPCVNIEKGEGIIDEAVQDLPEGGVGVGHTRWATHGEVNRENAHPHTDCNDEIAVVHNGIITNHREIREELEEHNFESDTDTEVIPHLFEDELEKNDDIKDAAESVMARLEGSYAVTAVFKTGEIVAFRNRSPLVMGIGDNELFIASDVTPFLPHTDKAVFLEDGDLVIVDENYTIFNNGEEIERDVERINWDAHQASKNGHNHFMEKEILEQPTTVKRSVFQDRTDIEKAVKMVENADNIYLTGCGTAGIAASLGSKYFRESGFKTDVELSHELEYRKEEIGENDLVIAISQSGETADLLSVLRGVDATVLGIVNVVGSTLARNADHALFVNAGPEIGVASTKAFTAQISVLKLLSYALSGKLEEGRESLIKTAEAIDKVIEKNEEAVDEISDYLVEKQDAYFIGRNKGFEMAEEAALKLKELSYIHAEAFPGGEFKHGTLALVEEGTPIVSFMKEEGYEDILSNTAEAKGRGADIIAVGSEIPEEGIDYRIEIPEDENPEILEVLPFQMLAYKTAVKLGHNPDKPRNLAKSITVK